MSHRPPVFTHAADPLDAGDWLKTMGKMLSVMTGRRSYMLQDDSRGQQEHGGMLMLLLMLHQTTLPGRSSPTALGATTLHQG
jgi:hypothetical protein